MYKMKVINIDKNAKLKIEKSYIALGNFDGLHRGHMKIIDNLVGQSKKFKVNSAVLLFESHTNNSIYLSKQKQLTTLDQKIKILEASEVDLVFIINFDEIKNFQAEEFIYFLKDNLNVCGVFVGYDYSFGKEARGDTDLLKSFASDNFSVNISEAEKFDNEVVSSTIIKSYIKDNKLAKAEALLNRPYILDGKVVPGKKLGSTLGFPTANIQLATDYVLPSEGVYVSEVFIDNKKYIAATSLGKNYTLDEKELKVEAHIINFKENIYNKDIEIRFIKKIRPMLKFSSTEEMTKNILRDIDLIKNGKFELE